MSGSSATTDSLASLDASDLSGIEAALVYDRMTVAQSMGNHVLLNASIAFSDGVPLATVAHQGRRYMGGTSGNSQFARRGQGGCQVGVQAQGQTALLQVGAENATVERLASGGFRLIRGNGSELVITPKPDATDTVLLTDGDREWLVKYGDEATEPLFTLTNTRSGRLITVTEDDDGNLTVSASGGWMGKGRWNSDGTLDLANSQTGGQHRYRRGGNY